jgi:hypothetical protein
MDRIVPTEVDQEKIISAPQIYATAWIATFGPNEFTILPAQTIQIAADRPGELESTPVFHYMASIWTSPQAARDLVLTLSALVKAYEEQNGTIPETPFSKERKASVTELKPAL